MTEPKSPPDGNEVVALSRWRAALARARKMGRVDTLLAEPDAERLIQALPVQELFYAIKETGLADSADVVALASPDQVIGFLDLDVWQKDQLDENKMRLWIEVIIDAGLAKLKEVIEAIDPEAIALYLQKQIRVYDLKLDAIPDEPEGHFYPTVDTFFLLDIVAAGEEGKAVERLIDMLYRADLDLARNVVMSARSEVTSDLEEWSYRFRSGRMADLGYIDYYEALEIYRPLEPGQLKLDEEQKRSKAEEQLPNELPIVMANAFSDLSFIARALTLITDEEDLARLQGKFIVLGNKVMAADRVEPGDVVLAASTLRRVADTLALGLESLAKSDVEKGAELLVSIGLERIFRVGFTITLQFRKLAEALVQAGLITIRGAFLAEPPHDALLRSLSAERPLYTAELEGQDKTGARPFASLADVKRASDALAELGEMGRAVFALAGLQPTKPTEAAELARMIPAASVVRYGTLARTLVALQLLGRDGPLQPILPDDLAHLPAAPLTPTQRQQVEQVFAERLARQKIAAPQLSKWLDRWLENFAHAAERPDGLLLRLVQ